MKTIKEQYREIVCGFNDERTENVANRCTEIADKFAIEFAKWLRKEDIPWNAEKYFGYTDLDMIKEFKTEKGL